MIATPTATLESSAAEESAEATHCVPLAALTIDGTAPDVGDPVDYTVKGTITKIEGAEAYVTPEMINDQPAKLPAEPTGPEEMSNEDVMAMAMKADAEG